MKERIGSSDAAIAAAGAAVWIWTPEDGLLAVRAASDGVFSHLDGVWPLGAFLRDLSPEAASALRRRLHEGPHGDGAIEIEGSLLDGTAFVLLGSWTDPGAARGLVLSASIQKPQDVARLRLGIVYQPIRRLEDSRISGFEALARFSDEAGRAYDPAEIFLRCAPAERAGLALRILTSATQTLCGLREQRPDLFMQVNLMADDLADPALVIAISDHLEKTGLPRGALRIEVTEQAAIIDFDRATSALAAIRAAGAGIILDDFGAGHSSFAWLSEIAADGVKLDPALVRRMNRPRGATILSALTRLLRSLGMSVTAEGVEEASAIGALRAIGCDYVQGFAFDRPLSADELGKALDDAMCDAAFDSR